VRDRRIDPGQSTRRGRHHEDVIKSRQEHFDQPRVSGERSKASGSFDHRGGAEGATARRDWDIAESFQAFFSGRVGGCFAAPHSREDLVHRQHDEKIHGGTNEDK
jgi:hypothetical protein